MPWQFCSFLRVSSLGPTVGPSDLRREKKTLFLCGKIPQKKRAFRSWLSCFTCVTRRQQIKEHCTVMRDWPLRAACDNQSVSTSHFGLCLLHETSLCMWTTVCISMYAAYTLLCMQLYISPLLCRPPPGSMASGGSTYSERYGPHRGAPCGIGDLAMMACIVFDPLYISFSKHTSPQYRAHKYTRTYTRAYACMHGKYIPKQHPQRGDSCIYLRFSATPTGVTWRLADQHTAKATALIGERHVVSAIWL